VAAYRVRSVIKVTTEGRNPTIENIARLNDSARQRGWQEATVWTQSFGQARSRSQASDVTKILHASANPE
jgi:hypothetical protein